VQRFLHHAAPPLLTSEVLTALRDILREQMSPPQNLQILVAQAMRREHRLVSALKEWLDAH
jgi:hypothetical protein